MYYVLTTCSCMITNQPSCWIGYADHGSCFLPAGILKEGRGGGDLSSCWIFFSFLIIHILARTRHEKLGTIFISFFLLLILLIEKLKLSIITTKGNKIFSNIVYDADRKNSFMAVSFQNFAFIVLLNWA